MKKEIYQINSLKELDLFAKIIIKKLSLYRLITLRGELGSGKTAFTQSLARAFKIKTRITSPTFVITKIYPINNFNIKFLCHVDLYRVSAKTNNNLEEFLSNPQILTVIEWPEKIKKISMPRIDIQIKIIDPTKRLFIVQQF